MKKILNFFKKHDRINRIELFIKIVDHKRFDEVFMPLPGVPRVQPHWDYYPNKGVISVDLGTDLVDYLNTTKIYRETFDSLMDLENTDGHLGTINPDIFKGFSIFYVVIHYTMGNRDYINIYDESSTIDSRDFIRKNFKNIEYANCKAFVQSMKRFSYNDDVTDLVRSLSNNPTTITPELILLYSPHNMDIKDLLLKIVKVNC
jgi:hypothetical protein